MINLLANFKERKKFYKVKGRIKEVLKNRNISAENLYKGTTMFFNYLKLQFRK